MKLKARLNLFGGTPNISINLTPSAASHFTLDSFNVDPITPVDPSWLLVRRTKSDVYPSGEALKLGCHLKPDVGLSVWGIRGACLATLGPRGGKAPRRSTRKSPRQKHGAGQTASGPDIHCSSTTFPPPTQHSACLPAICIYTLLGCSTFISIWPWRRIATIEMAR